MAKNLSYFDNLKKELGQTAKTASNALDKYLLGNRPVPKGIKIGPSNIKKEAGQLAGALLKGRQYDDKTGKQVKKATAKPMTGIAKPVKKAVVKKK